MVNHERPRIIDGYNIKRSNPNWHAGRFESIQDLRLHHYGREFLHSRTPREIEHFVGRLTVHNWIRPQKAVGVTARKDQWLYEPVVVSAFDEKTNRLKAYSYGVMNISSSRSGIAGFGERSYKLLSQPANRYIKGAELVADEDVSDDLLAVLVELMLENYDISAPATWYTYNGEEPHLEGLLQTYGYVKPEEGTPDEPFGPDSEPVDLRRWYRENNQDIRDNIFLLPGVRPAVEEARLMVIAA